MNQPYTRVHQPYATLTLASALREMFGVQLYKNNARALLSRILSILNLDWLQHARSVRWVYETSLKHQREAPSPRAVFNCLELFAPSSTHEKTSLHEYTNY